MIIEEIRIYAEVLEQGIDFKEYIYKCGLSCPIKNIYSKKIHREIKNEDSIVTRIRKSKDADVLITALSNNHEYPLLMVEYSTAVPTDDHKMQRSDVYYWGAIYKVPIMKIYPKNKGMDQQFGGGNKIRTNDELLLTKRIGAIFYPIEWSVIKGTDILATKSNAISCIKENKKIHNIISNLITTFQNNKNYNNFYISLLTHLDKKNIQNAYKVSAENRDYKKLISNSTRFQWHNEKLTVKINRFGHAMDPDRGVLFFVNMLLGLENVITEIQVNRSSVFDTRGGYKSLFDAAPNRSEMCQYVKEIIKTKNNVFTDTDALYIINSVWGLPSKFIEKSQNGQYTISDENLYNFLINHPSMATKSIFFLSKSLILTDINRKPICTITWNSAPIKKYLGTLYNNNYAITTIEQLDLSNAKEDIITFASVELYKKLKFDLLAVSYPGAQGDRCILTGNGRNVSRTYIDIIAYEESKNGITVYLEECKDNIAKSYTDVDKLHNIIMDSKKMDGLNDLFKNITGKSNKFKVNLGVGAKQSSIRKPLNVDYIFMFDIDNSNTHVTAINYNVAIINTNLVIPFTPLCDHNGKLVGTLNYPKIYVIK